jgi:glycosyltransferase involved in cell wall biosynthesis
MQGGSLIGPAISIFMPAFNAARHIEAVIARVPQGLWPRVEHVWIVDDGSLDGTSEVVAGLCRGNDKIRAVHFDRNLGYGTTVREGLARCKDDTCDIAVCLHADGQYPPEVIGEYADTMAERGTDILQGSRIASGTALSGGMPMYKYLANRILTFFENIVFGLKLTDYHSGMLFYSRKALDALPFDRLSSSFDFDLEVIALARSRGLSIAELPVPARYGDEISYLNPIAYGLRVVGVMARYLAKRYTAP